MKTLYLIALASSVLLTGCGSKDRSNSAAAVSASSADAGRTPSMPTGNMSAMGNMSDAPGAMTGTGSGTVTAIDKSAGTITLKHGPIPGVRWPAMTMEFKANPASLVNQVAVGDTVTFDVKVEGSSDEVTAVRKP